MRNWSAGLPSSLVKTRQVRWQKPAKFVGENPPSSLAKTRQVRCFAERIMLNSFVSI